MERLTFERHKLLPQKLTENGFSKKESGFFKAVPLLNGQFVLELFVCGDGAVETKLLDAASEEEFVLHLVPACTGAFVAEVRAAYNKEISYIKENCFTTDVFKGKQTAKVLAYAKEKYGVSPEYLWEKTPNNAVLRRSDTGKWFAAILTVRRDRLSLSGQEEEEIIDFRVDSAQIPDLLKQGNYLSGYHMNKKHWVTVLLNGSVSFDELKIRIDESYALAK